VSELGTRAICALNDLSELDARAFSLGSGDWPLRGFVVRKGDEVFAYLNRCPHAGHPLNWTSNEFLTQDKSLLMCRSHGALFAINSGVCVAGPCTGRELRPIPVIVDDGMVMLRDDPDKLAAILF
jgi:nitrite reductase/ring-hydroxylating ferredoxin subunit